MTAFHVGDTVVMANSESNIADGIDGLDGYVIDVDPVVVDIPDFYVIVLDSEDITLSDCPHLGENQ